MVGPYFYMSHLISSTIKSKPKTLACQFLSRSMNVHLHNYKGLKHDRYIANLLLHLHLNQTVYVWSQGFLLKHKIQLSNDAQLPLFSFIHLYK